MGIIDRYVLRLFARVLVVCFASLVGLYLVIDVFNNLEEFLTYAEIKGGLGPVLALYYAPRILTFFDLTSPLLTVISGVFTLTWLQRSRELTAIMAAGVSPARVVLPLLGAVAVVCGLTVVNRELLIPQYQDGLSRNAQNWLGQAQRPIHPCYDKQTGINLSGKSVVAKDQKIIGPVFRLSANASSIGHKVEAEEAQYMAASENHPAGYLLNNVSKPADIQSKASVIVNDHPVVLTSFDNAWLQDGDCFVASGVPFSRLTGEQSASRFASTAELIAALRNPSLDSSANVRIVVHSRFVQPLLDISLFLMGIALVLTKKQRNMFVAAGLCLIVVNGFYALNLVCQALGSHLILSAPLAAWSPLLFFGPLALYMASPIWD